MRGSERKGRFACTGRAAVVFAGVSLGIALWLPSVLAQKVFRWTDDRGVIHYAQSLPPPGTKFQVRNMPTRRPVPTVAPQASDEANEGEARIELSNQSGRKLTDSARIFSGTAKNSGKSEAKNVTVSLTITETAGGNRCLTATLDVSPSSLKPGEEGTFEGEFEHPCLLGEVSVEMVPDWD